MHIDRKEETTLYTSNDRWISHTKLYLVSKVILVNIYIYTLITLSFDSRGRGRPVIASDVRYTMLSPSVNLRRHSPSVDNVAHGIQI